MVIYQYSLREYVLIIYPDFPMDKSINNEIRKTIYRISLLSNLKCFAIIKNCLDRNAFMIM